MDEITERIDELARLMEEFQLSEAQLSGPDWKVAFRRSRPSVTQELDDAQEETLLLAVSDVQPSAQNSLPKGIPVSSPMNGIYYSAPSPSSPPFVKEGDAVGAGQVVALIEAMKVFNEIMSPISGIVDRIVSEEGQIVQPGEPLLYIV